VARAKRTDRAEARRKYRAYLLAQEETDVAQARETDGAGNSQAAKPVRSGGQKPQPSGQPVVRLGIVAAAKAAYLRPTYIDDLRSIRALVFGSHAAWPIFAICVASGAYFADRLASNNYSGDPILPFMYQFLFYPVPLLPPMLAGFLAPRATWLAGAIAAGMATLTLVAVIAFSASSFSNVSDTISNASPTPSIAASASATALVTSSPISTASPGTSSAPTASPAVPSPSASPTGTSKSNSGTADLLPITLVLLAQSLAFGALMGALSGWYKRFLAFTGGGRKPASRSGGQKPAQRRPAAKR
jgi:hypothetical protein